MNKVLRFSLLSVLMMLCGTMWADEVTFDFTGANAYELFGFSGFSSGDSHDGDFTETKELTVDGVTLAVSPSTTNTANRMWNGSLRVYGGTLSFSCLKGKVITAIQMSTLKWNDGNTADSGTLVSGSWTGSAQSVVISIAANTQIKTVTVTLAESGSDPDPVDPDPQPGDEVKSVSVADFLAAPVNDEVWYQLKGKVKNLQDGDQYGNFDLEDATGSVYVYGLLSEKGGAKKQFQELVAAKGIQNGCTLTINGTRGYYEKEDKIEVLNAYFVAIEGGATPDPDPDPDPQPTGKRQYKKATSIESGKPYLIVAESKAAKPVPAKDKYGWLYVVDVEDVNGVIEMDDETNDFVFTSADGGYTIMQSDGRYLYQKGTYNNFNVDAAPTEGQYWTVTANADGTFKILNTNVNKWMQYSINHTSYGSYADEQGVMPTLYVLNEGGSQPVVEEKTVTFDATKDMSAEGQGEFSLTKDGVTMSITYGMLGDGKAYRYYKGSSLTFSAPGGTITKIEFTSTANADSNNGLGGIEAPATGIWTVDGKTAVWTGAASEVVFTMGKQVRATLVNVTYMDGEPQGGTFSGSQLSKYPYANPELIAEAQKLIDEGNDEQLAEVMKDVARSHALAEGLAEAEDITSQLGEWTLEEFAASEGIEGEGYNKAEGKDIVARVFQTVPLKAGRYMLTATGRGQKYNTIAETIEERLQVMAINNDRLGRYQSIARNDREGGVYGEGWDDASDYFTMTADGEAVLGAYFKPIAGRNSWAEVGNFRLVRLGDATRYISQYEEFYNEKAEQLDVLVHRTLKQGEWNSIVLPMDLDKSTIEAQFGKDTKVAVLDKATDGVVEFKSLKEAAIDANVPVLLKPTAVKESNRYLFRNVPIATTVSTVVKAEGFDFVGYYNPDETPVEGGLGFDVVVKNDTYAAVTTSAALVPTGDAQVVAVKIDGETYWEAELDPEAKMAVIGATVPTTPTAIDAIEQAQQADAIYNAAGQRVQQMTKGLYIVGGKKVVIK